MSVLDPNFAYLVFASVLGVGIVAMTITALANRRNGGRLGGEFVSETETERTVFRATADFGDDDRTLTGARETSLGKLHHQASGAESRHPEGNRLSSPKAAPSEPD